MANHRRSDKPPEVERAERSRHYDTTEYTETDVLPVRSRISWGALFAGALVALATVLLLTSLGAAVGLTASAQGADDKLGTGASIWGILTLLIALFLGGWVSTQVTAGENKSEGMLYGVLVWGLMCGILLALTGQGVATGVNAMTGVATVLEDQTGVDLDRITQNVQGLTPEQRAQMDQNVQQNWDPHQASQVAWWTFLGIALSILASCGGAVLGAGPSPRLRLWVIEPRHQRHA